VNKLIVGNIKLLGYDLNTTETESKGKFSITYYWQSVKNSSKDYIIYQDVVDQNGNTILEGTFAPIYNIYPPSQWPKGEVLAEKYNIILPSDIPSGTYRLVIKSGDYINPLDPSSLLRESKDLNSISIGEIKIIRKDS